MKKKKKSKFKKQGFTFLAAFLAVSSGIFSAIAAIPTIESWIRSPKLEIIRQSVHVLDDRIIGEYLVLNSGSAIANDIFLQIEASESDQLYLPFSAKHEIKKDGKDWIINIESLNAGESTGITVFSNNVKEYKQREKMSEQPLPELLNIWIDYREGERKDVSFDDSKELKEYIKTSYGKENPQGK